MAGQHRLPSQRADDEDAALLRLGADFQNAKCLLNAEVALILQHKIDNARGSGQQPKSDFMKAYEYVNRVKRFKDRDAVTQVRTDLEKKALEDFELAQLGNLCPDDAEEAKALVPSLDMPGRDITHEELSETLQQIAAYRQNF